MPWTCKQCNKTVEEDSVGTCPACDANKSAWTVLEGQTRQMVVPRRKRVDLRRGSSHAATAELVPADAVRVTTRAELSRCAESNLPIPPAHVLTVQLTPKPSQVPTVTIEVLPEEDEAAEHLIDVNGTTGPTGRLEAKFVFVYGEGQLDPESFPDLSIIDVDDGDGYAPSVEISSSLARAPVPLELGRCRLALHARDRSGGPLGGWRYEVSIEGEAEPRRGTLDDEGRAALEEVHQDRCRVRLLVPEREDEQASDLDSDEDWEEEPVEDEDEDSGEDDDAEEHFPRERWDDDGDEDEYDEDEDDV